MWRIIQGVGQFDTGTRVLSFPTYAFASDNGTSVHQKGGNRTSEFFEYDGTFDGQRITFSFHASRIDAVDEVTVLDSYDVNLGTPISSLKFIAETNREKILELVDHLMQEIKEVLFLWSELERGQLTRPPIKSVAFELSHAPIWKIIQGAEFRGLVR